MFLYLVIATHLLCGCWVVQPIESQTIGNRLITRHSHAPNRVEHIYGSDTNGNCSLTNGNICNGTSVLNNGIIPALDGVSSNLDSLWATELFTLRKPLMGRIILSFEVDSGNHDRMVLAVFNCPAEMGISLPLVNVYFDSSFRPDRDGTNQPLGNLNLQQQLTNTSCDHLLVFCVPYSRTDAASPTRYINLEFPFSNTTNSTYVFLGEVTFLNGGSEPCDPTMPITITEPVTIPRIFTSTSIADGTPTDTTSSSNGSTNATVTVIAVVVVVVLVLIVIVAVIIILVLFMRLRKHKQKHKVQQLQSVVLETKEEEKEAESYMDNQYDVIDKPPQNGVKAAPNNVAVMDALYSNPNEAITDDTYSRLRDSQKKKSTPHSTSALSNEYSRLNRSQTDPVVQKSRRSPAPQNGPGDYYASVGKPPQNGDGGPGDYYASVDKPPQNGVDGPGDYYASVDKPPQNGVKVAVSEGTITDMLYSNPDEIKNDTYSHLRDGPKKVLTQVNSGASDDQYSKLNRSQTYPNGPGDYYASVDKPPQNGGGGPGDYYASVDKPPQNGVDGPGDYYASVDKPPQNGVKVAASEGAITDMLYSNPDEIKNDTYSHLRDGPKKVLTQVNSGASDDQYSKLNRGQADPNTGPSPDPPVDERAMYAVPDKKKQSENTPAVPEKSSELVEYLDIKETQSREPILQNTPEYSEIESSNKRSGSVGPVTLSNPDFLSGMSSNPLYRTTDIRPLHMMPTSTVPQSQPDTGVLEVNAIYAEPLPPTSTHELEWDPDQNIYESIYSEPLNPSLFMQNRESTDVEELRPYMSIYTVPAIPSIDKPLSVSIKNIKEIKHLGDGNFGQVVLAQTVGLTPKDLRLEGDAPYTLVAVKKLKPSASNRNRQLFDKEISFISRLNHPNVIRLLGVCAEGATPFIMMEYMTNGDLNQYLNGFHSIGDGISDNEKSISLSTLIYMSTQIASAMQYLASQNFVHRDLATRNCLVGSKDTIKISDFGMSRSLYESQYYVISGHAILPIRWMATECFFGKFSAKTDVWAFGVTMWEIFTLAKDQPYSNLEDREVVADIVKGPNRTLLKRPTECPESMYEIMQKCWVHDASQRPTFDELFNLLSKN